VLKPSLWEASLYCTKAKTCPEVAAGALDCKCEAKNTIHYSLSKIQKVIPVSSNNNDIA